MNKFQRKTKLFCLLVAAFAAGLPGRSAASVLAQDSVSRDSICVYYLRGYSNVNLELRANRVVLDSVAQRLRALLGDTAVYDVRLLLTGSASPEGTDKANLRLSQNRAKRLLAYLQEHAPLPDSVRTAAIGVDWQGLIRLTEADPQVPRQQEALDILRNTPLWVFDAQGRIVDGRKRQLMNLAGGNTFRYMDEHLFPDLRTTAIELRYKKRTPPPPPEPEPEPASEPEPVVVPEPAPEPEPAPAPVPEKEKEYVFTPWSLKTNLLYDLALMPSLEVEYRINDHWSAAIEGNMAWWHRDAPHKYYQLATIVPEVRYWFRPQGPCRGHYLGLMGGGGWYDLENGGRGYKGEGGMIGVSYGYQFPVGRYFAFEAGAALGYMHTEYEEYLPIDGCYVYQQTNRMNYFGPLRLRFSWVWRIGQWIDKKGGAR